MRRWDRIVDCYPEVWGDPADRCGSDRVLRHELFEFSN